MSAVHGSHTRGKPSRFGSDWAMPAGSGAIERAVVPTTKVSGATERRLTSTDARTTGGAHPDRPALKSKEAAAQIREDSATTSSNRERG